MRSNNSHIERMDCGLTNYSHMNLLNNNQKILANLHNDITRVGSHLTSASYITNQIANYILSQSDEELTYFLNNNSVEYIQNLFNLHAFFGETFNSLSQHIKSIVPEINSVIVDTSSFVSKLARQNRTLSIDENGVWSVTTNVIKVIPEDIEFADGVLKLVPLPVVEESEILEPVIEDPIISEE